MPPNNADNLAAAASRTTRRARGGRNFLDALVCALIIVVAFTLCGCAEPTTQFRGKTVTADSLPRLVEAEIRAQQERDRLEAEALMRAANKRRADFEIAVARLDAQSALELASLRAEYEASAAEMSEAVAAITRRSEAAVQAIRADAESARESIDRQNEQRLGVLSFAEKVLPMTPAAPWTELILGGGAALLGVERIRKGVAAGKAEKAAIEDRDKNWEEGYARGKAEAEAKADAANKAWEEAILNVAAGRLAPASRVGPA